MVINEPQQTADQTIRALIQHSDRGPKDLALATDHPRPAPGPGDYLIRVVAAGVNFADVMQTRGRYGGGPEAPYVAGFEAAGEIVGIGADVERPLPLGTHVIGAGPGAFAQYMTMPAAGALPVPTGWSDTEALGMVLNWVTALAALKPLGEISTGDVVLIHAAAGGVGQAAEITRLTGGTGADLVLESVGKATFTTSLTVARPFSGRVVVFGAASGDATVTSHDLVFTHHATIKGLHIGAFATQAPSTYQSLLTEIDALIACGVYPPGNPQVHPLAEGPDVLRHLEGGATHGKHSLDPWR